MKPCWYKIHCSNGQLERRKNPGCSQSISVDEVFGKTVDILSKPNISYCIVYANDKNIRKCLERIKEHKRKTDQVVVANNGCKTFTEPNVNQLFSKNEYIYIENKTNLGCILARNQTMKAATGITLFILDDDQFINSDSLHKLQSIEADIVGTEAWSMDRSGYAFDIKDNKGPLAYVGGGGLIVKKKIVETIGYLDENYAPAWFSDADFCYKAKGKGYTIGYHPNPNIEHLKHQTVNNQKDFDSQEAWRKSHRYFCNKWLNKKKTFNINLNKKPKINILIDSPVWCWNTKSINIKKWLSDDFDIDITFEWNQNADVYFSYERRLPNRKAKYITGITAHVYNNIPNFEQIMKNANAIHANSILLFNKIKYLNNNCHYVPNGIDEKQFEFFERNIKEEFTACYVGKDIKRKGLRDIIIPACQKADVKLKTQVAKHNSTNRINYEDMPKFYHDIDCVVIASDYDGTPNFLIEGGSIGRTFIGNNIGNVPEFYIDGNEKNGIMISDKNNVNEYVKALKYLKENREECRQMGIKARETIEKSWTWKNQAENYRKMFWSVV